MKIISNIVIKMGNYFVENVVKWQSIGKNFDKWRMMRRRMTDYFTRG